MVRHSRGGQHHHVGLNLYGSGPEQRVDSLDNELAFFLVYAGNAAAHVVDVVFLDGPAHKFLIVLSAGPYVHVEHIRLSPVHLVLVEHGVLGRIHAAYLRAVGYSLGRVARPAAGDEHHLLRHFAVRRPPYLAKRGPGCGCQALKLQPGDDVGVAPVAVFREEVGAEHVETGGHNHRPHLLGDNPVFLAEAYGVGWAHLLAHAALARAVVCAVLLVDDGLVGHGLRKRHVDGRAPSQSGVKLARNLFLWAFRGA